MLAARRARFERCPSIPHIQLTKRDIDVLARLDRHRLLRSCDIYHLIAGSRQQVLRRLQLLFHHGYVDRPRSQIEYFHRDGSQPFVYALSPRGVALLRERGAIGTALTHSPERKLSPFFLRHAVQKSEVMVAIELACRRDARVTFIPASEFSRSPLEWRVNIEKQALGVKPDDAFALEYNNKSGERQRALFFVESDRATMPIERRDLAKTSFRRKLLAYEATWLQRIHQSRFGHNRFRVLTITTSPKRVEHLVQSCSKLKHGRGLFLFTDLETIRGYNALATPWRTAYGAVSRILD